MIVVSIDLETTGLNPVRDQVLEIGAVAYDFSTREELGVFSRLLHHEPVVGSAVALSMNAGILKRLASGAEGVHPQYAWYDFARWLPKWTTSEHPRVTAAGKNFASFDRPFIEAATLATYGKLFHHRSLDPVTLWTIPATDVVPPDTAECCRRAGLPDAVAHDALADARQVIALLAAGWAAR